MKILFCKLNFRIVLSVVHKTQNFHDKKFIALRKKFPAQNFRMQIHALIKDLRIHY